MNIPKIGDRIYVKLHGKVFRSTIATITPHRWAFPSYIITLTDFPDMTLDYSILKENQEELARLFRAQPEPNSEFWEQTRQSMREMDNGFIL